MSVRDDLAQAANTVEGITCSPYYSQSTKPGTAFVRRERTEYPQGKRLGGWTYWQVVVVVPQSPAAAEQYIEQNVPALLDALDDEWELDRFEQAVLVIPEKPTLFAVFISGHREEI